MRLKDQLKQWQHSEVPTKRFAHHVAKTLWRTAQLIAKPEIRATYVVAWRYGDRYFQRSVYTIPNRYPALFEKCKSFLASNPHPKILSFGCSTGEEVFSLGEYLPQAQILGVDINEWCIRQCNLRKQSNRQAFCLRYCPEFERASEFDAILCMAVFQRTENRTGPRNDVSSNFTFAQFERELGCLDAKLKRNGLLVIDHADFSFADTVYGSRYKALESGNSSVPNHRPLFDPSNRKIADTQCLPRLFVKQ